ncbi:MAG: ribonucleoside triphosphate reductase [Holosporales bacterium]|nr:ribonucleoside triphosphate reductase [Holosporales bacterium]
MSSIQKGNESVFPNVTKRDGTSVSFDESRIISAVARAGAETGEFNEEEAKVIASKVKKVIKHKNFRDSISVEDIQDIIEQTIITENYFKTARAYIVYREKHSKLRRDRKAVVDAVFSVNEYLEKLDWRVQANANQGYSLGGMILNLSGKIIANYWLSEVYPEHVANAHRSGDFHIHDLDMLSGYCAGWSLRMVLEEGFNGVPNKVESLPPSHLSSALGQLVNFLGTLQNEWAGAQAFSSFDTYMSPFVRKDNISYPELMQKMQEFIYNLNVPSRWGSQCPFTNLTFDWVCPDDLAKKHPIIGGKEMDFVYGDLQKEMDMINKAFMQIMAKGDAKGRVFTFPIPTYNISKNFIWEGENADLLFEMTAKYGLPYFQNFVNSELDPGMIRSMCCRLQLDLRELLNRGNSLFGSAEQTGSIGVVTINAARLGYLCSQREEEMFKCLDELMNWAKQSLEIKRKIIEQYTDMGLYPFTKRYLGTFRNHFSTIGVNGLNELIRNFTHDEFDITSDVGQEFAARFLDRMRQRLVEFQKETGHLYNLEATPAEGTTYRFAKEDQKKYPDIIQAGTKDAPYYTNSSQLPVGYTSDPFLAMKKQEVLQRKYTGGTVMHLYMGERLSSADACRKLVQRATAGFRIPSFSVTPTFSICSVHGYLNGEQKFCSKCDDELRKSLFSEWESCGDGCVGSSGKAGSVAKSPADIELPEERRRKCEVWTRVMGYLRPVDSYNKGKQSEYNERLMFNEEKSSGGDASKLLANLEELSVKEQTLAGTLIGANGEDSTVVLPTDNRGNAGCTSNKSINGLKSTQVREEVTTIAA